MKFNQEIIFNNYELTIIGEYQITYGIVDHVGWITGGEVIEQDIKGEFVKWQDVEIEEVYSEGIKVNLLVSELRKIQQIVARQLTEELTNN